MKLVDLLEQGKKARVEDFVYDYIYFNKDNNCILTDRNEVYAFGLDDLTREDWFEYEEYRVNFNISHKDQPYYKITECGDIYPRFNNYQSATNEELSCFNAFEDKKLAEYVQKRQLLDRQLMIFSHLNGGDKIEWNDDRAYYRINMYYDFDIKKVVSEINKSRYFKLERTIYFENEQTAKKALEIYGKDMEELLKMSIKLGF